MYRQDVNMFIQALITLLFLQEEDEPLYVTSIFRFVCTSNGELLFYTKFSNGDIELLNLFELLLIDTTLILPCVRLLINEHVSNVN